MRDIKFRAWREKQKLMLHPHLLVDLFAYGELENPDEVVWMQYTGLKDKNGVDIYEGDISPYLECSRQGKVNAQVYYCTETAQFRAKWIDGGVENFDSLDDCTQWLEVIGNIHQNQELLGN